MTFNRIQMLRNKPIKIARDKQDNYLYVQGPTIGETNEDEKLFLVCQMLMMEEKELKKFLDVKSDTFNKLTLINYVFTQLKEKDTLIEKLQKILLNSKIYKSAIYIDENPLTYEELKRIEKILLIVMGQKITESDEEKKKKKKI